jgi:hypothetical protein
MNVLTRVLQDDLKTMMLSFNDMRNIALELSNMYWKSTIQADIAALLVTDPVTIAGKYTKADIITALTLVESFKNMFGNVAVPTADNMSSIITLKNGNAVLGAPISSALEDYGGKALQFSYDLMTQYNWSRDADNLYNNSEIGAAVGVMSNQTVVYGSEMTKDDLVSGIVLAQQIQNFCDNIAVATSDYSATLAKWDRF